MYPYMEIQGSTAVVRFLVVIYITLAGKSKVHGRKTTMLQFSGQINSGTSMTLFKHAKITCLLYNNTRDLD
jgi:hypothetical protein